MRAKAPGAGWPSIGETPPRPIKKLVANARTYPDLAAYIYLLANASVRYDNPLILNLVWHVSTVRSHLAGTGCGARLGRPYGDSAFVDAGNPLAVGAARLGDQVRCHDAILSATLMPAGKIETHVIFSRSPYPDIAAGIQT